MTKRVAKARTAAVEGAKLDRKNKKLKSKPVGVKKSSEPPKRQTRAYQNELDRQAQVYGDELDRADLSRNTALGPG